MSKLFLLSSLLALSRAHKDGAPPTACLMMKPGHGSNAVQDLAKAPHRLEFAPAPAAPSAVTGAAAGTVYTVTIAAKDGSAAPASFKGFLVQARLASGSDANPVGTWDTSGSTGLAKGVACGNVANSAVTHVSNNDKPTVTLLWRPPPGFKERVVFVATVVKEFTTFWVGIQSGVLNLGGAGDAKSGSGDGALANVVTSGSGAVMLSTTSRPLGGGSGLGPAASTTSAPLIPGGGAGAIVHPLGSAVNASSSSASNATNDGVTKTETGATAAAGRNRDAQWGMVIVGFAVALASAVLARREV